MFLASVVVDSRLIEEFKTNICILNQAPEKPKSQRGNGLKKKLLSQWTNGKYSSWSFKIIIMNWAE